MFSLKLQHRQFTGGVKCCSLLVLMVYELVLRRFQNIKVYILYPDMAQKKS